MTEPKPFASLSPTLLARKGGAKPAMRPSLQPLRQFQDLPRRAQDDLGWNDMGPDFDEIEEEADVIEACESEIAETPVAVPEVVRQQQGIARRIAAPAPVKERQSALAGGRRAAFTLRVDGDRHLKLRLACTLANRSAQQIVTEALDRLIAEMPEVTDLADQVRSKRR
jgi:hypothetical protein